ncbi:MAG: cytochrome c oxidase subunit II transmembrane domain-containing protein, partial [Acidimicrobiales bacterium]|nr:cytochrome c oxidase subunit II transmembrane domain-containing protein [Acidimicrobiales bacterium]
MTSRRGRADRAASAKRRRVAPLALALPLVLLLGACADNAPQSTLEPEGPFARSIDTLWDGVFAIAVVVFVLVELGAVAIAYRFRRRRNDSDDDLPTQTHGNTRLEIAWTILPAVILAVVGFFTLRTLFQINERDDQDLTVLVTGQQWWWEF